MGKFYEHQTSDEENILVCFYYWLIWIFMFCFGIRSTKKSSN